MTYTWQESYRAAILETDWTKMQERLRLAERELHERLHNLSFDHSGTPEEKRAISVALNSLKIVQTESAAWQTQKPSDSSGSQA